MLTFDDAKRLADAYIDILSKGKAAVCKAIAKPYGWVFFYNSKLYLETGNRRKRLIGNGPFLIERVNGNLVAFGTAGTHDWYLEEYEKNVPREIMRWEPEEPPADCYPKPTWFDRPTPICDAPLATIEPAKPPAE